MTITLPKHTVATRDELRDQYIERHKEFLIRVERSIDMLCRHHRTAYEKYLFQSQKAAIQKFIDERTPNATAYDYCLAPHRTWIDSVKADHDVDRYHRLRELEADAKRWMEYIANYTTHPRVHGGYERSKPRPFDFKDYQSYRSWHEDSTRPNFNVKWRRTANATIKAEVKRKVDDIVGVFIHKTLDKVADILIAKGEYECELKTGCFGSGSFEGDLSISFADGTSFRTHVILKTNYTAYGDPYAQYPLTFHDIVAETGNTSIAMTSQDGVHTLFGVPKWTEPKKQKKPWSIVTIGDVLRTRTMSKCICLSTRGNLATVFRPGKGETQLTPDDIVAVLARTTRVKACVRVEPFEGQAFTIEAGDSVTRQFGQYAYGIKVDNAMRKACAREILKRVDG